LIASHTWIVNAENTLQPQLTLWRGVEGSFEEREEGSPINGFFFPMKGVFAPVFSISTMKESL